MCLPSLEMLCSDSHDDTDARGPGRAVTAICFGPYAYSFWSVHAASIKLFWQTHDQGASRALANILYVAAAEYPTIAFQNLS